MNRIPFTAEPNTGTGRERERPKQKRISRSARRKFERYGVLPKDPEKRRQLENELSGFVFCPEARCRVLKELCQECESFDKKCPYTAFVRAENEQLRVNLSLPPAKRSAKTIIIEYWGRVQEAQHRII
jgi:hypothetical protein